MIKKFGLVGFVCLLLASCQPTPDYSNTPYIEFRELKVFRQTFQDSIWVNIYFRDGNGDLGLATADSSGVYGKKSKFFFNYFINLYTKSGNSFVKYVFPDTTFNLNGRFPSLNPENKTMPIEGTLSYHFNLPRGIFRRNTPFKLDIQIADKATNLSNTVQTSVDTLR